jgi:peptidoglycan/LPS O-acetylase OafA/YrhL
MAVSLLSSLSLTYESVIPYFLLMALFVAEAWLIQNTLPFFKRHLSHSKAAGKHFVELDGLRGILAISVFFPHCQCFRQRFQTGIWTQPTSHFYTQLGFAPVAVFFLITGFLFWSKAQKGTLGTWPTYFKRRLQRLYPAYLLALILIATVVAFCTQFQLRTSIVRVFEAAFSYLTFVLVPAPPLNNFAEIQLVNANVFWSLRVEWMFYISLVFLAFFARTTRRQIVLALIAVSAYFALPFIQPHLRVTGFGSLGIGTLEYFNNYLVCYFSVGMAAAFIHARWNLRSLLGKPVFGCIGVLATIAVLFLVTPKVSFLEGAILGIPFLLIVFGNSFWGLLRLRPLVLLGEISYSTYILHGTVLFVVYSGLARAVPVASFGPLAFWAVSAVAGMIVVALSSLSYRYVESPFMAKRSEARSQPVLAEISHAEIA